MKNLMKKDGDILLWIQHNLRHNFFNSIFIFITRMGDGGIIWILAALIMISTNKNRSVGINVLISILCTVIINNIIIKTRFSRVRPYDKLPDIKRLIEKQRDFSFPSGHTASSFAAAMVIYRNMPHIYGIAALSLAALIGFSRMYLGVHYPSDVICGAVSGTIISKIVSCVFI